MTTVIKGDSNINLDFSTGGRITGDFSNATVANRVWIQSSTTNGATNPYIVPNGTATQSGLAVFNASTLTNAAYFNASITSAEVTLDSGKFGTGTYLPMTFYTGGAERVRIDTSGNVGIGTSSPASKLHVAGSVRLGSNGAEGGEITFDGTSGSTAAFIDLDGGNNFRFYNANATFTGFFTSAAERMRITAGGELMVGSTNATNSRILSGKTGQGDWNNRSITLEDGTPGGSQPGIGFHAAGNSSAAVFKMWGGSNNFECRNASDSGFVAILASAFPVSSDYRIKTDVVEFGSVLSNVLALRPVNYEKDGITGREYGLIAHEAAEHFPDLVRGEKDGMRSDGTMELQTVSYTGLTSVLVKAIQEQQAIITALTARVEALEAK